MEIERKVESELLSWKTRSNRQPLLLLGARQVGKSFTAAHFGRTNFTSVIQLDFQTDLARLRPIFEPRIDPPTIISEISLLTGTEIKPEETLLIFDEVQLCPAALTSLKYFAERTPEYPIIATGSLFGVSIPRQFPYTFPVGKVNIVNMYPLDFEEFLGALGKSILTEGIRDSVQRRTRFVAHDDAMKLVRQFMMTGGLPRAVDTFEQTGDWEAVRRVQRQLASLYAADMALYATNSDAVRTRQVWDSVPQQLSREANRKFVLADIQANARYNQFEVPFAWLEDAGLIYRHYQTEQPVAPLRPRTGGTYFKVYLFDTGILSAQLDIPAAMFCSETRYVQLSSAFRGGIVENYVKQALVAAGRKSQYWTSGSTAEIDFLLVDEALNVVPMEVKSGDNTRSRSLDSFIARYDPKRAIRLSSKNFGQEGILTSLPLYSVFCLDL